MSEASVTRGRVLWVDDEVDRLRPHTLLLIREGYDVDAVMNGDDALELLERVSYDLILLDEQMPGRRGIEILSEIRARGMQVPVVMVTKSEADDVLHEAIGRRADDYIVKPTSPRQVLSVVTRILAGPRLRHERIAREFTHRFGELRDEITRAGSWQAWADLYSELVDWELRLEQAGEPSLSEILRTLQADTRRGYSALVAEQDREWVHEGGEPGPPLSVDVLERFLLPLLSADESSLLVVVDCLRLDQWRAIRPLLTEYFEVEGGLLIIDLVEDTPAYNAGLREFDVVVEANGEPVTTIREFRRLVSAGPVDITFVRRGQKWTCRIGDE